MRIVVTHDNYYSIILHRTLQPHGTKAVHASTVVKAIKDVAEQHALIVLDFLTQIVSDLAR